MMRLSQFLKLLAGSFLAGVVCPELSAQDALVTNVSRFEIPFEVEVPAGEKAQGFAVLYSSIDNGATWEKLQTVPAAQQAFQFAAPRDGTYAFAVRMTDAAGNLQSAIVGSLPELQVTVDTTAPELRLELYEVSPGQVVLNWQTSESADSLKSLTLEYADGQSGKWIPVSATSVSTGQTSLQVAAGSVVSVRGTLVDNAGNRSSKSTQLVLKSSVSQSPTTTQHAAPLLPTIAGNQPMGPSPFANYGQSQAFSGMNPGISPTPNNTSALRTSAVNPPAIAHDGPHANAPIVPGATVVNNPTTGFTPSVQPTIPSSRQAIPAEASFANAEPSLVNSQLFDLIYQVEDVGPSGVGSVDIYITENGGQQWFRYGNDPDLQSPFQVDVRGEGTFGFAVRVRNGLGFADPPPQPGEAPSIVVTVDQTMPAVNLATPTVLSEGSGVVNFQWQISERLPAATPVRLEYSTTSTGPWTPAFDWQADTGNYQWPIRQGMPGAIYFRLLARDAAGNVGSAQTNQPVLIDLKRPTVRSLRVQAVSANRSIGGY